MIGTIQNTLVQVSHHPTRARELTIEANLGTKTEVERKILNTEFLSLNQGIEIISTFTMWRGKNLLDASLGALSFQVGSEENQTMQITFFPDINTDFGSNKASQVGFNESFATDLDVFTNLGSTVASTRPDNENIDLVLLAITGNSQITILGYTDTAIERLSNYQNSLANTKI